MRDETGPTPPRPRPEPPTAPTSRAAARPPARVPAPTRRSGASSPWGCCCAVLGFAAVVQVQSTSRRRDVRRCPPGRADRADQQPLAWPRSAPRTRSPQLRAPRNSLLNDTEARRTALERARQLADAARASWPAPCAAVGPGVRVTVQDASGAVGANHLINGIQELRDAGAEAIEINDASASSRRPPCGTTPAAAWSCDGSQLTAPYVIEAIGAPHDPGRPGSDLPAASPTRSSASGARSVVADAADGSRSRSVREPSSTRVRRARSHRVVCPRPAGPPSTMPRSAAPCIPRT